MALNPEKRFQVSHEGDTIISRSSTEAEQRIRLADISAVYFEAGEGPFEIDWWILEGSQDSLCFPLGATGEGAVLELLKQLPGFEVRGMNSVKRERFLCWRKDDSRPR